MGILTQLRLAEGVKSFVNSSLSVPPISRMKQQQIRAVYFFENSKLTRTSPLSQTLTS